MSESRIAIIAADGTYTYDQLDEASRRKIQQFADRLEAGRGTPKRLEFMVGVP